MIQLDWLASEPQGSACLCSHSAGRGYRCALLYLVFTSILVRQALLGFLSLVSTLPSRRECLNLEEVDTTNDFTPDLVQVLLYAEECPPNEVC